MTMILNQTVQVESQFGIIYTIDEGDDWTTDEALIKANPNWGVSVNPETLFSHREKALTLPSAANNFKTKYLDVWCSAKSAWMDMKAWKACEDPTLDLADFEGQPCVIGLDLAAKNDLVAKMIIFLSKGKVKIKRNTLSLKIFTFLQQRLKNRQTLNTRAGLIEVSYMLRMEQ